MQIKEGSPAVLTNALQNGDGYAATARLRLSRCWIAQLILGAAELCIDP